MLPMKILVSLTLCGLLSSACDSEFGSKTSGQACTRTSQCAKGLLCLEGLCHSKRKPQQEEPAADAGEPDATTEPEAGEPSPPSVDTR
jgi:hypothetical protein